MKFAKTLAIAAAIASVASMAHAATTIYITGSTAFRAATTDAVWQYLTAHGGAPTTEADDNGGTGLSTAKGANHWNIINPNYIVQASWNGSAAGVQAVGSSIPQSFLAVNATGNTTATPLSAVPTIAMSDVLASTTPFGNVTEAANSPVGIIPFYFVRNKGSVSGFGNMTPQIAQNLWSIGFIPLSFFSGNNSDENTVAYATGRNDDSGTRLTAFAETGVVGNVQQFVETISGANGSGTITSLASWPVITVNGIVQAAGNGGESSGGTLAKDMSNDGSVNGINLITYLGESDTKTALTGGASVMSYCGITPGITSAGPTTSHTQIAEGQYTFWGNEHVYCQTGASSTITTFAGALADEIANVTVTDSGIASGSMNVQRGADGGNVVETYAPTGALYN